MSEKRVEGRGGGSSRVQWPRGWLLSLALACAALLFATPALSGPTSPAPGSAASNGMSGIVVEEMALPGGTLKVEVVGFDDPRRVAELRNWIDDCVQAALTANGRLPLRQARVRIQPATRPSRSPVPWGQTLRRDGDVAVLLFVREDATAAELRADWTAVHELAHLFHPFLGDDGRWLAEGLASYYQNVLRARAGLMEEEHAWRRLDAGFARGRREGSGPSLQALARGRDGTMRVYWAGAAFWLEADLALRARGSSLDAILAQYAQCCLRGTGRVGVDAFIADLDRIAGADVFAARHARYAAATGFPALAEAYATLGLQSQARGLRFSDEPAAQALRRAIMGRPLVR